MESQLKKYEPLAKVITYDGEIFFVDAQDQDRIEADCNANPFGMVRLGGKSLKYKDIKRIEPHKALGYEDLPRHLRSKVEALISKYKETFNEHPSEKQIEKYVEVVLKEAQKA